MEVLPSVIRPQAVTTYVDEIRKVTNQPIKYLIYSHRYAQGLPFVLRRSCGLCGRGT